MAPTATAPDALAATKTAASYTVAVRELCEFTAKRGNLDLRFTPAPTAQEGMASHAAYAKRQPDGYQAEIHLTGEHSPLRVRGRADGYDPAQHRLDEVKTHKGPLERQPASHRELHWAQAKVYGWLLCQQGGHSKLDVALVYIDAGTQQETRLVQGFSALELRQHFEHQCEQFVAWAMQEQAHRSLRDEALAALAFPFGAFREGQRELAEAVYKAAVSGRTLLAQAPTGIGKTVATVFPALKAMPGQRLDRLFFLTAKTSGRQPALEAFARLATDKPGKGLGDLRILELVAREKSCEHPDKACHGDSCQLAHGFYDRLPAARAQALAFERGHPLLLSQGRVKAFAAQQQVCPYYMSLELARWSDVVVGDYNHFFDHGALLHGLTLANQWRVKVLVDEAHNLLSRARTMHSAELLPGALAQARSSPITQSQPAIRKALNAIRRQWLQLGKAASEPYVVLPVFPPKLLAALQQFVGAMNDHWAEHPLDSDAALLHFYFDALLIHRLAETLGDHSMVDLQWPSGRPLGETTAQPRQKGEPVVGIRNVVPAPFLSARFAAAHSTTLFSATLQPMQFHADLLGLPDNHVAVDVASPFRAQQLHVRVARHISTRFQHRHASVSPLVALMAEQFSASPGNYLAFFSSHAYLADVLAAFSHQHAEVPVWSQSRGMSEPDQKAFLARFQAEGQGIGFAVLGGSFAEGVDLPGQRLIGAFVATLGLPQLNPVNHHMRQRMEAMFAGRGDNYTFLFPGLQKVVQAAGRVIRTPQDQGVVWLMDDRFARSEVQDLLPRWWGTPT